MENKISAQLAILGSALGMFVAPSAVAQSDWTGAIDNDYNNAGNWNPAGVPSDSTDITINSGTSVVNGTDSSYLRQAITTIDGGILEFNDIRVRNAEGGPAAINVLSGGITQNDSTYFIVGRTSFGTVNQSGGLVDLTLGRGFFLTDGAGLGGTYNLTGGILDLKMNRYKSDSLTNGLFNAWIGRGGNTDLMNVNGGTFNLSVTGPAGADRNVLVARNSTFRVDSGTVDMDGLLSFTVGQARVAGTTSNFEINGGNTSLEVAEGLIIGAGVSGSFSMTNGSLDVIGSGADMILGDASISDSVQTGGKSPTTTSTVNQSGGDITLLNDLILALDANNTSTYTMTGGSLFANDIRLGLGSGLFEFLGGTITLNGDRTSLLGETWFDAASGATANFDGSQTFFTIIPEPGSISVLAPLVTMGMLLIRRRSIRS